MSSLLTLQNVFREVFDDARLVITPTTSAADIDDWDSVAQVKLVLAIEAEFGFRLATEEVSSIRTVGGFLNSIERRTRRAA